MGITNFMNSNLVGNTSSMMQFTLVSTGGSTANFADGLIFFNFLLEWYMQMPLRNSFLGRT